MSKTKTNQKDRWVKQWRGPSESSPDKFYTVSLDHDGSYSCHCWPFLRTREPCKHIEQVKDGIWPEIGEEESGAPEPEIVYYNVQEVEPEYFLDKKTVKPCKTPTTPFGHTHFLATLMFDLHRYGVSWRALIKRYKLDPSWKPASVEAYLREHGGRKIYGDWVEDRGFDGFKIVPMPS